MEKNKQQNNMQSSQHLNGQNAVDLSVNGKRNEPNLSPPDPMSSPDLNYVMLDVTSQPFLYFHENILKDYMCTNEIDSRIESISITKKQLIEELKNIYSLQKRMQDLLTRFQNYKNKKS